MKFFVRFAIASGLAAAAPLNELPNVRVASTLSASNPDPVSTSITTTNAASTPTPTPDMVPRSPLLSVEVGGPLNIGIGSTTVPRVEGGRVSSVSQMAASSVTMAPESTRTYATTFPSTFSAPVQGSGILSLKNLPAMPAVIDKTLSGALGAVYGLMSGSCNEQHKCSITVAGSIQSLLVDGDQYAAESTISAWCDAGRCFGSANPTVNATAPFEITCDKVTGTTACSGTIAGLAEAVFMNGKQVELWGWLTPSGYCQGGLCTASIDAFGDPMY